MNVTMHCNGIDTDKDGIADTFDNCANVDQLDIDINGTGDICDNEKDNDGVENGLDNCPIAANSGQEDLDSDDAGDVCDNCVQG